MSSSLAKPCAAIAMTLIASAAARAADVTVQPAAGSGFVVKDATGANERLRVQETGAITLPGMSAATTQATALCFGTNGQLGPCASTGGDASSYTAGTGLSLANMAFSIAPTYQLPQGCSANQVPQWTGSAWVCATSSASGLALSYTYPSVTLAKNNASTDFLYNSQYSMETTPGSYTEYFTRYFDISVPAITQDVLDTGMVQVYFTPNPIVSTNDWRPLPFRFLDGSGNFYYIVAAETSVGQVEIEFFFEQIVANATLPVLSSYAIPAYNYKIVVIAASQSTSVAPSAQAKPVKTGSAAAASPLMPKATPESTVHVVAPPASQ
jgi:hypothetical protein